ncbi:MAG: HAD-IC family P-type ATPase [Bifidobacteriaceae bacterium]|nr:HAD-IC family P-type ATPase [Bifidobacteriaceae bacterium]
MDDAQLSLVAGLTDAEVQRRISLGQVNDFRQKSSRSWLSILRSNVLTIFNFLLIGLTLVVLVTGSYPDALFGFVIIVNSIIGILVEYRAKRTLDKLSVLSTNQQSVIRDGVEKPISFDQIVLDDILVLRSGDQILVDGKVLQSQSLRVDESQLTGESDEIDKKIDDQLFSGSYVTYGQGIAKVIAVGADSFANQISNQSKQFKLAPSDLRDGINAILRYISFGIIPLSLLMLWSQVRAVGGWELLFTTDRWREALVLTTGGIVGMIPEGLVLLTSLNFALSSIILARQKVMVQQMQAVETLARIDVLCLDKTGTITTGEIRLDDIIWLDELANSPVRQTSTLINRGRKDGKETSVYPNETAAGDFKPSQSYNENSQSLGISASSYKKLQALFTLVSQPGSNQSAQAIAQGVSKILSSTKFETSDSQNFDTSIVSELSDVPAQRAQNQAKPSSLTMNGSLPAPVSNQTVPNHQLLITNYAPFDSVKKSSSGTIDGVTYTLGAPEFLLKEVPDSKIANQVEVLQAAGFRVILFQAGQQNLAIIKCSETIRDDAKATISYFLEQGVHPVIISGDSEKTVRAIANQVGVEEIYTRVTPQRKVELVQNFQMQGKVVAMTGDGVNDALALKTADLGIAQKNASAVTKSVSELVLLDGKFSHLPEVVAQGRRVMANMERVASLFLVKTFYSVILAISTIVFSVDYVFLPRQMTIVSALTIGIPAFFLALPANSTKYTRGFLRRVLKFSVPWGIGIGLVVFGVYFYLLQSSSIFNPHGMATICIFGLAFLVLMLKSRPLLSWRLGMIIGLILLSFLLFYLPLSQAILELGLFSW